MQIRFPRKDFTFFSQKMAAFTTISLCDDTDDEIDSSPPPSPTKPSPLPRYPDFANLPPAIQSVLRDNPTARLWETPAGFYAFRYGNPAHRVHLVLQALREILHKIDSSRDHSVVAHYLANYFGHSVRLYLRREGDLNTRDYYIADEKSQVHRLGASSDPLQTVCDSMNYIIEVLDTHLLHEGSPSGQRREIDRLKQELRKANTPEKIFQLKAQLQMAHSILNLRAMLTSSGNKQSIAKEYLSKITADCQRRGIFEVLDQDSNWLPMKNGYDLNLTTLQTRKRCLDHHITGLASAVFTIPPELTQPEKLTAEDRRRFFGVIPGLINKLAAEIPQRAQAILITLFLQLLGKNRHKYLIIYQGEGNNGKSLLLTLLREALGELCAPLHKSILFGSVKDSSGHSNFQIQLDSIRCGFIDDLGIRDTFNEQAVKILVSEDVELVMRECGNTRRGASKARFRIACGLLLNCNALPQIKMDRSLINRFRILPFEAMFTSGELIKREDGKPCYKAEPGLLDELKQPHHLSHFINYVVMAGRYYYQRHIASQGEPLVNEPQVQEELERALPATEGPSSSSSSSSLLSLYTSPSPPPPSTLFQDWWESHMLYRPGESIPIAVLAAAYAQDTKTQFRDPGKDFGQLLQTHFPHIARDKKKQLMTTVEGVRAKRMVLVDYELCKQEEEDDEEEVKKEYPILELDSDEDY